MQNDTTRIKALFITATAIALLPCGCGVNDLNTLDRRERGLVIVLPGIEGPSALNVNIARGLDEGGLRSAIEIFDWGTAIPGGALVNLTAYERNRRMAGRLRDHVVVYQTDHPRRSVHVIGHSGGGGLAVLAAELLPDSHAVTSIVLLAPALSPDYDLRAALRHTRYGIFNYHSSYDAGFLGVGTTIAGTIDRRHVPAAGAVGFDRPDWPDESDRALYGKLHQIAWRPEMRSYGHFGGHMGWAARPWVRRYLAPLLMNFDQWPDEGRI